MNWIDLYILTFRILDNLLPYKSWSCSYFDHGVGTGSKNVPSTEDGSSDGSAIKLSTPLLFFAIFAATYASTFTAYWFLSLLPRFFMIFAFLHMVDDC